MQIASVPPRNVCNAAATGDALGETLLRLCHLLMRQLEGTRCVRCCKATAWLTVSYPTVPRFICLVPNDIACGPDRIGGAAAGREALGVGAESYLAHLSHATTAGIVSVGAASSEPELLFCPRGLRPRRRRLPPPTALPLNHAPGCSGPRSADDSRDVIHRAVQALAEGKIVAFPTETVYGLAASALCEPAVERLINSKDRAAGRPLALAVRSADEALDYVPNLSLLGQRRCASLLAGARDVGRRGSPRGKPGAAVAASGANRRGAGRDDRISRAGASGHSRRSAAAGRADRFDQRQSQRPTGRGDRPGSRGVNGR